MSASGVEKRVWRTKPKPKGPALAPLSDDASGIERAVHRAGGSRKLADQIGVTRQAVEQWQARGWAPLERAKQIHDIYRSIPLKALVDQQVVQALGLAS